MEKAKADGEEKLRKADAEAEEEAKALRSAAKAGEDAAAKSVAEALLK